MKKITPKLAQETAEKYFLKHRDKIEEDFARTHTKAVVEIVIILAKKFSANKSVVETSAWVHDIGAVIERPNHANHSLDLLKKDGFEISVLIEDCILNHGTSGKPKSKEAKLLQMADKLSILSIPVLRLLLEQESISSSDIEFLNKMTNGAVEHLRQLSLNK